MNTPNLPFGYRLAEHHAEQRAIATMKLLRFEGLSYGRIADKLNEANVPCRGDKWHVSAVWRILEREKG